MMFDMMSIGIGPHEPSSFYAICDFILLHIYMNKYIVLSIMGDIETFGSYVF